MPSPTRNPLRVCVGVAGVVAALAAAAGVLAHFFGPVNTIVTLTAAFTPLFVLLAVAAVLMLVAARLWVAAGGALLVAVLGAGTQLPLYIGEDPPTATDAPTLKLLQANILYGGADVGALVDRVRRDGVDLLTVSELTVAARDRLEAAGVSESLPYSYTSARSGGSGEGIYSRHPLRETEELSGLPLANLRATVDVPGAVPYAVYALHPTPPYPGPVRQWAADLDRLRVVLANETRPLLVGADFNATYDHERFRALLAAGERDGSALVDAAEFTGSGIVTTYPADRRFSAVVAIDRILTRGGTPLSFERVEIPGSDHHGVMGEVLLAASAHR
ncbi:endonuclease/exonuclease/phosphatase family protein [Mycolicibacterium sp. 624]|uniref:endonuclease/exonuclease/phosphatase family protein n=1 Tax=Mycolicibacterium sp. 624 TaxID=3156314 RepID=UPI003392A354